MEKDFDAWNEIKKRIETNLHGIPFFKQGEIWWVSFGLNIGVETDGKGESGLRPALILRKYNRFSFSGKRRHCSVVANEKYRQQAPWRKNLFPG